ncbi:MAG: glycoside hydrolase family 27 protein [Armatimonadota bacterium]
MSTRNALAPRPPLGWNSFSCYGIAVVEAEVWENARYMASQLAPYGWEYIIVDGMWYQDTLARQEGRTEEPFPLDDYGRLLPNPRRFPSADDGNGFRQLAKEIHDLGLKFGIHIMRGIPRLAVERNCPILGTPYHAQDIADTENICPWYAGMYGVNMAHPGGQAYYDALLALYAEWGVDYIKADDTGSPYQRAEIEGIATAIERCGRPIVLSLSIGSENDTSYAEHRKAHCELWRVGSDLHDNWRQVHGLFDVLARWAPHAGPGHWPDADMLPLGMLHLRPDFLPAGEPHFTKLTADEQVTLLTLCAIVRSPLMFAGDLPGNDPWTLGLLTNEEVLAVNQCSQDSREWYREGTMISWTSRPFDQKGLYLAAFNRGDEPLECLIPLEELGMERCTVRDLWMQSELGEVEGALAVQLPPHAARLYRLNQTDHSAGQPNARE